MSDNININGSNNVKWSRQLAEQLDAQDGKKDGKIDASIWNSYLDRMGSKGNRIQYCITIENAVKSFDYYNNKKDKGIVDWSNWKSMLNKTEETPTQPKKVEEEPPVQHPKAEEPEVTGETGDLTVGTYTETGKSANELDGIIDKSAQRKSGDCWLITGLSSLSETKWGRNAIKNAMQIDEKTGDVKITLKGAYGNNKVFTVTKAELEAARDNDKYSYGDMDTVAFEIAIEKYRKQFGETLDGGHEEEVYRLITGSHNTQSIYSKSEMKSLIEKAKADPEKYAISANFVIEGEGAHAYNVSRFETDESGVKYVVLTNPWVNNREIKMTEAEFLSKTFEIQALENPTGKSTAYTNNSDGKIGNTTSSTKNYDKNVASAIYAVANSDPQLIKDSIKRTPDNGIAVTLKGVGKTYTISAKELEKARDSGLYTQGDDDVLALEIAMEKYGKEQAYGNLGIEDDAGFDSFAVHSGTDIYAISDSRAIYLLTGQENMYAVNEDGKYKISNTRESIQFNPKLFEKLLSKE